MKFRLKLTINEAYQEQLSKIDLVKAKEEIELAQEETRKA